MSQPDIEVIEALVNHRFTDRDLVRVAVRHASVADTRAVSNERMEFLGDAVLGLITCERIYQLYPEMLEGEMTKIKSKVVSRETCAQLAVAMGLHLHLQLGKGMRSPGATVPMSLAAAALESVIAALFLDAGIEKARAFIVPLVEPMIREAEASKHQENYKSLLQHHAQQGAGNSPQYIVIEERGPDHSKHFLIAARVGETQFDGAWGASKKIAEQAAAERALRTLGVLGDGVGA